LFVKNIGFKVLIDDPLNVALTSKAHLHGLDGLRVVIYQNESAAQFEAGRAGGAAAGEEVKHDVAGV